MESTEGLALMIMGISTGLVEVVKSAIGPSFDAKRFGALLSVLIGVATAIGGAQLGWFDATLAQAALAGLVSGLAGSGLYESVKAVSRTS